jgi:hypothetical protein
VTRERVPALVGLKHQTNLLSAATSFQVRFSSVAVRYRSKKTPWPQSASELYRPSDRRLSAELVPTVADRRCHVVSVTGPYGRILGFLDRSRYFFFQVAPQLYS